MTRVCRLRFSPVLVKGLSLSTLMEFLQKGHTATHPAPSLSVWVP